MIFSFTRSSESFGSISLNTSTEPCTSALMTSGSSLTSPALSCSCNWSSVMRAPADFASVASRSLPWRNSTMWRARASSATWNWSPASGAPCKPRTSTGVAAPFLGHQSAFGKLALHALDLRFRLIDFVNRDNNRNARGLRVVDGFLRLRHHAIIGRNDKHDDVRDFRAARAHARERFVARRIDEYNFAAINVNDGSADMLGDSSGLSRGDFSFADGVKQAGLAVIDVAHHGHDGRSRLKILRFFFAGDFLNHVFFKRQHLNDAIKRFRESRCGRRIKRLVNTGEDAAIQQKFQDFLRAHIEVFREVADRHAFRNRNFARFAPRRRGSALNMRGTSLARTDSSAHGMQFSLAFFKALFDCGTRTRRGLTFVNRLPGLRLGRHFVRRLGRSRTSSRARTTRTSGHRLSGAHGNLLSRAAWSARPRRKS